MKQLKDYINGQWVDGTGTYIDVYNPSTGEVIAQVPVTTADKVEEAIQAAAEAFKTWKDVPLQKRMGYLFKLRDALVNRKEELAQLIFHRPGQTHCRCPRRSRQRHSADRNCLWSAFTAARR